MNKRLTLFMVTAGCLLTFTGLVSGQEVNSDVKIPPPRELASGAPAINGRLLGTELLFRSWDQLFQGSSAQVAVDISPQAPVGVFPQAPVGVSPQAAVGISDEGQTRAEFGDFMTSLLVRAGLITFDRPPAPLGAPLAASRETSKDGSRPAWTGRTPMTLSVSRTGRSQSLRQR